MEATSAVCKMPSVCHLQDLHRPQAPVKGIHALHRPGHVVQAQRLVGEDPALVNPLAAQLLEGVVKLLKRFASSKALSAKCEHIKHSVLKLELGVS